MSAISNSSVGDHYPAPSGSADDSDGMSSSDYYYDYDYGDDDEDKEEEDDDGSDGYEEEEEEEDKEEGHDLGGEVRSYEEAAPKRQKTDRISTLSDNVLLHILSFLKVKEIIRTGTLSKRWQHLWPSVSTLEFNMPNLDTNREFVANVCRTLALCDSPYIKRFEVGVYYKKRFASDVNLWLRFATRKKVEDLRLNCFFPGAIYPLPQYLYTNSSLTKLDLVYCHFKPKGVISWISLKSLYLNVMELRDETIGKILSGCPVLESLDLCNCHGMNCLNINSASLRKLMIHGYSNRINVLEVSAPNIQSLAILGHFYENKFRLLDVSSLVDVELGFYRTHPHDEEGYDEFAGPRNLLIESLEKLHHLENLKLGQKCIEIISIMEVKGLPSPPSKCKCLMLDVHITKWTLPGIASLLESSPDIDTLIIKRSLHYPEYDEFKREKFIRENFSNSFNFDGERYWTSIERSFKCLVLNLKIVKIVDFAFVGGHSGFELQFVQFLLQNALALEKMVINAQRVDQKQNSPCCTSHELLEVMQNLLSFPRSSQHAVVIFT